MECVNVPHCLLFRGLYLTEPQGCYYFYLDYSPMQQSVSIVLGEKNTFNFMKSLIVRNFLYMQVFKNNYCQFIKQLKWMTEFLILFQEIVEKLVQVDMAENVFVSGFLSVNVFNSIMPKSRRNTFLMMFLL